MTLVRPRWSRHSWPTLRCRLLHCRAYPVAYLMTGERLIGVVLWAENTRMILSPKARSILALGWAGSPCASRKTTY